jgi:O-antigen/teichoic acid export membrane protein
LEIAIGLIGAIPLIIASSYLPMLMHKINFNKYTYYLLFQAFLPFIPPAIIYLIIGSNNLLVHLIANIFIYSLFSLIILFNFSMKKVNIKIIKIETIKLLFDGSSIGYASILNILVSRGWYFWISSQMGLHAVGVISVCQSIAERLSMIGDAYGQAGFRRVLLNKNSNNIWNIYFKKLFFESLIITILIGMVIFLLSEQIFSLLPKQYNDGAIILKIFLISYICHSMYRVIHHMLLAAGYANISFFNYFISGLLLLMLLYFGQTIQTLKNPEFPFLLSSLTFILFTFLGILKINNHRNYN